MAQQQDYADLSYILNDLNARIRVLEGKYNLFGEKLLVINKNMISEYKLIVEDVKNLEASMKKLQEEMEHVKEILKNLVGEMQYFARKENVTILEKYIKLWNPLRFVTHEEVKRILAEGADGREQEQNTG